MQYAVSDHAGEGRGSDCRTASIAKGAKGVFLYQEEWRGERNRLREAGQQGGWTGGDSREPLTLRPACPQQGLCWLPPRVASVRGSGERCEAGPEFGE